jgi:outer membrane protein OmpA-like peptidoglycan-associated protein
MYVIRSSKGAGALAASALAVSLCVAGCQTVRDNPRTATGTAVGAATGAGAGAAIGAIAGGGDAAGKGAAIGAIAGAIGGGLVGNYMDRQERELQAVLSSQDQVYRQEQGLEVVMASDVLFESGEAQLQPGARDRVARVASVMQRYPDTTIAIVGHTDSRGSTESNEDLSRQRADAVADALIANGVSQSRIRTYGEGETRPIASNDTTTGRAQNRRVEIEILPDESLRERAADAPYEEPR